MHNLHDCLDCVYKIIIHFHPLLDDKTIFCFWEFYKTHVSTMPLENSRPTMNFTMRLVLNNLQTVYIAFRRFFFFFLYNFV